MGLRLRKSVKIAPGVKMNLSAKSSSVTFGTKGFHHTVGSNGKRTTSVGVPGTGLNYVSTSSGKKEKSGGSHSNKRHSDATPKKKMGCLAQLLLGIFGAFSVFIALAFILSSSSELTEINAVWTANEYNINESTEVVISPVPDDADIENLSLSDNSIASLAYKDGKAIVTFNSVGSEELFFIADNDIKSEPQLINVINQDTNTDEISDEQAAQAEAERIAAEQAAQAEAERIAAEQAASQASQQSQERMVWISATGSKYHRKPDCGKMNPNNASQMPLSQAESQGYGACSKCY